MANLTALPALDIRPPADPIDSYSKVLGVAGMLQNQKMQGIQLQQAQQAQKDSQAMTQSLREWDASKGYDALTSAAIKNGVSANGVFALGQHVLQQRELKQKVATGDLDLQNKQNDLMIGKIRQLQDLPDDQISGALGPAAQDLTQKGLLDPEHAQIVQHLQGQQPQAIRDALDHFAKGYMSDSVMNAREIKEREVAAQELTAKNRGGPQMAAYNYLTGQGNPTQPVKGAPAIAPPDQVPVTGMPPTQASPNQPAQPATAGTPPAPTVPQIGKMNPLDAVKALNDVKSENKTDPVRQQQLDSFMANPPKGYKATPLEFMRYEKSITPAINNYYQNQQANKMSDPALDNAAEKYWTSGTLPAGGRGPAVMAQNQKIMNRAAELHPGESITEGSAAFKANQASLTKLQTQFDSVDAFEKTATKNIDRLLQTAKDIPDLGTRFMNVPARMISSDMIGTVAMAKFKADLLTAQNEAAKVLNSANASGVLSDSARHELQEMAGGNLPLPAMTAAFNELKNDMGNRHDAYQQQINDIKGRMKTTSHSGTSGAPTAEDLLKKYPPK